MELSRLTPSDYPRSAVVRDSYIRSRTPQRGIELIGLNVHNVHTTKSRSGPPARRRLVVLCQPVTALGWLEDLDEEPEPPDTTPRQEPKLSDLEATLVRARDTRHARIECLMAEPDAPEMQSLLDLFERPAWHAQAACRGASPDLFFPERGSRSYVEALSYCAGCPVRSQCLASALEVPLTTGVCGGTSGRDRKELRRGAA